MTSRADAVFSGFPADTIDFYRELKKNNNKEWFEANRERYESSVLEPAEAFVGALGSRLREQVPGLVFDPYRRNGSGSVFRIRKDVRFSKDKSPYKTNLGMLFWVDQGRSKKLCPHFYVGVYPEGGLVHGGLRRMSSPLIKRYREAVAGSPGGERLREILDDLADKGMTTGSEHLERVPRPYGSDHPHATLLRYDGVFAETEYLDQSVVTSPAFIDACLEACEPMIPLVGWLSDALGSD